MLLMHTAIRLRYLSSQIPSKFVLTSILLCKLTFSGLSNARSVQSQKCGRWFQIQTLAGGWSFSTKTMLLYFLIFLRRQSNALFFKKNVSKHCGRWFQTRNLANGWSFSIKIMILYLPIFFKASITLFLKKLIDPFLHMWAMTPNTQPRWWLVFCNQNHAFLSFNFFQNFNHPIFKKAYRIIDTYVSDNFEHGPSLMTGPSQSGPCLFFILRCFPRRQSLCFWESLSDHCYTPRGEVPLERQKASSF